MGQAGRRIWRWIAGTLVVVAVLSALTVAALRVAFDRLPGYQREVAAKVKALTGLELRFSRLDARLGWYGPEIFFENAAVLGPDGHTVLISASAGRVTFSLLRSAWNRRVEVGRVTLDQPRLNVVIFPDDRVELVGQSALQRPGAASEGGFNLGRLRQGRLTIRDAAVHFADLRSNESWDVTDVSLDLVRDRAGMHFEGHIDLPRQLGSSIDLDGEFLGDLGRLAGVRWRLAATARNAELGGWARLVPASWSRPVTGRGYLHVMAKGSGRQLDDSRLDLELRNVIVAGQGRGPEAYRRIAGDFRLSHTGARWDLNGKDVEFSRPGASWQPSPLVASVTLADGRVGQASLAAPYLDLSNLAPLASVLPAGPARDFASTLDPSGVLRDVEFNMATNGLDGLPTITGGMRFRALGFGALGNAPGLRGLDGRLEAHGSEGQLELDSGAVQIAWPAQFRDAIGARASAVVGWRRVPRGVQLWTDDCRLDTGRGRAAVRLRMLFPVDGSVPLMDLAGTIVDADARDTWRYLPVGKLSPKALGWLDPAFRAGTVTFGKVDITGPVKGFPYRDGQGRFHATAHIEGVTLEYAHGWAPLQGATADAEFTGAAMQAHANGGTVGGISLGSVSGEIADWHEGELVVRGEAEAPVGPLLAALQESPLGPKLGATFMALTGSGRASGGLLLYLPIKHFDDRAVTAVMQLDGVTLSPKGSSEVLSGLSGPLTVMNREIYLPHFTGEFLGGAVGGTIDTRRGRNGRLTTLVDAGGVLDGARLQKYARLPTNSGFEGTTDWRVHASIERPGPEIPSTFAVEAESSLLGLSTALPEPFAKPANRTMPVGIGLTGADPDAWQARITVADHTRGALEWRRMADRWQLDRGELVFGPGREPVIGDAPGVRLRGTLARASLSALLDLRWPEPARRHLYEWLAGVDLAVGEAEALGYAFDHPTVRLRPGDHAWDVDLDGPATRGRIVVPYEFPGDVPLVVDMDVLHAGDRVRAGTGELDPRHLPEIRFDSRDFLFDGRRYGHLRAQLDRGPQGLSLQRLDVRHADFSAKGRGSWIVDATGQQRCQLSVEASTTNALGFLTAMGYGPWIQAKLGKGTAELSWPGPPDGTFFERLSGTLSVTLADGQIPEVEPGAGRVLGLMSITHLPRRLALDFKDVFGHGLAFDSVTGDFVLRDGDAFTRNLTLRGPAAEIGVVGSTNLRTRHYDQTAVVTGDLGATIGIAGALAGGPAVGAALLLFSQVFKEPLKGMTRAYYRISGPWEQPAVQRIGADEARESRGAEAQSPGNPPGGEMP